MSEAATTTLMTAEELLALPDDGTERWLIRGQLREKRPDVAKSAVRMTTEQLLALPDNGTKRWLIRGELRELPMTFRNRKHCSVLSRMAQKLRNWLDHQPPPHGEILVGEAGVRLQRDPEVLVGVDLTYIQAELVETEADDPRIIDGVPLLMVEVLSPSDRFGEIWERVDEYRRAKVPVVWLVDPHFRTVLVFRPDAEPVLFNADQDLSAEPHLPGFQVRVASLFQR